MRPPVWRRFNRGGDDYEAGTVFDLRCGCPAGVDGGPGRSGIFFGRAREVYRSLGWDYVCTVGGTFYVWRCDDPDAPELDSFWWRDTGAYPAQVLGER